MLPTTSLAGEQCLGASRSAVSASDPWATFCGDDPDRGVSEQVVRKPLANGTLAGERRGRAWVVDPSMHAQCRVWSVHP